MSVELLPLNPEQHHLTFIPKLSAELPFFNLTQRKKDIPRVIKYQGTDPNGRPMRWEVYQDTSSEIGPPGVEAHEVWVLLIKPAIDAARREDGSIPEIIPLGGMRQCLRWVGWSAGGHQAKELIKSLTQISFAGCVADLWFPTGQFDDKGQQKFIQVKGRFSRLSVYAIGEHHLTEEELAQKSFDFDLEDVLYIRLDPIEARMQQLQDQRVFDNQYLFSVKPAARRWYELMAAKLFGVVKNKGQFCEIRYSWYVKHHHTLKRFYERREVVKQMEQIVKDHLATEYISKVEYRAIKEPDQELDFIIRYYPGEGAKESIARIQGHIYRRRKAKQLAEDRAEAPSQAEQGSGSPEIERAVLALITAEDAENQQLLEQLVTGFGITAVKALELLRTNRQATKDQLAYWPHRGVTPKGNKAGWLIRAIETGYGAPAGYEEALATKTRQRQNTAKKIAIENCSLCDARGFRLVKSERYPRGAMRECSHDPAQEARYQS
jgi:hypothetical protein